MERITRRFYYTRCSYILYRTGGTWTVPSEAGKHISRSAWTILVIRNGEFHFKNLIDINTTWWKKKNGYFLKQKKNKNSPCRGDFPAFRTRCRTCSARRGRNYRLDIPDEIDHRRPTQLPRARGHRFHWPPTPRDLNPLDLFPRDNAATETSVTRSAIRKRKCESESRKISRRELKCAIESAVMGTYPTSYSARKNRTVRNTTAWFFKLIFQTIFVGANFGI